MSELTDTELLAELGVEPKTKKEEILTPLQERVVAGFEEIQRFVETEGRSPSGLESNDIFERIYAARLGCMRRDEAMKSLLFPLDHQNLLGSDTEEKEPLEELGDEALLAELGVEADTKSVTNLTHVRSHTERKAAEEIAGRERCKDFDRFAPLFERVQVDITSGVRVTRPFRDDATIEVGHWFILDGIKALVVAAAEEYFIDYATEQKRNQRLRVIFENGTESNLLKRSLERALQKDPRGRRITDPSLGPLFAEEAGEGDQQTGTIYVLRSLSTNSFIAEHREVIHKIGVTTQSVESRIANAARSPTYLMADVEVVAKFTLFNVAPQKFEKLLHKVFQGVRLSASAADRFGDEVGAREWFLVPLETIVETVDRIIDGTITQYRFSASSASLVLAST